MAIGQGLRARYCLFIYLFAISFTAGQILPANPGRIRIGVLRTDTGQTVSAAAAEYAPLAAALTAAVFGPSGPFAGTPVSFEAVAFDQWGASASNYDLANGLTAHAFDYLIAFPSVFECVSKNYPGLRNLAGRIGIIDTADGFAYQAQAYGAGAVVALTSGRPLSELPQNASDLAGRVIAMLNPLTTASPSMMINYAATQGVNFYQAARMVGVIDTSTIDYESYFFSGQIDIAMTGLADFASESPPWVTGVNVKVLPPLFLSSAFPVPATAFVPEMSVGALYWANATYFGAVETALLAVNTITAPQATLQLPIGRRFAGFTAPFDNQKMREVLFTTGIAPGGAGTCVQPSNTVDDVISTIVCEAGYYRLARSAIVASCTLAGIACPDWAVFCVCKPCRKVPSFQWSITLSTGSNSTSYSCSKLAVCASLVAASSVVLTVADQYGPTLRSLLGLPQPQIVSFTYSSGLTSSAPTALPVAIPANTTRTTGDGAVWILALPPIQLGYFILTVIGDNSVLDVAPTVIHGIPPSCTGGKLPTAEGLCSCPTASALTGPLDPSTCSPLISISALIGGLLGATLIVGLAVAALMMARFVALQDAAWIIALKEIELDVPPVLLGQVRFRRPPAEIRVSALAYRYVPRPLLGQGTFGQVFRGRLRGSTVALKTTRGGHFAPGMTESAAYRSSLGVSGRRGILFQGARGRVEPIPLPLVAVSQSLGTSADSVRAPFPRLLAPRVHAYARAISSRLVLPSTAATAYQVQNRSSGMLGTNSLPRQSHARRSSADIGSAELGVTSTGVSAIDGILESPGPPTFRLPGDSSSMMMYNAAVRGTSFEDDIDVDRSVSAGLKGMRFSSTDNTTSDESQFGSRLTSWFATVAWASCGLGRTARLRSSFLKEIRAAVNIRHPKVVQVIGAIVETTTPIMVMEFLERGALSELLLNVTLGDQVLEMIVPILIDIVEGMMYLHGADPPLLHNDLKSCNVLVDSNFSAKICDFGISRSEGTSFAKPVGSPPWMAPEILRGEPPSVKSDCYSFGILVWEVFARKVPYAGESLVDVLEEVAANLNPPKRPWGYCTPPEAFCPLFFGDLMARCTANNPSERPSFAAIADGLNALDMGSLMSNLMARVADSGLSTSLLHSVFPPRVAEALKEGRVVEPESYDCVTIYFSDIVGFTDISSRLTPEKVMMMLNRLYLAFDRLTLKYGLFKARLGPDVPTRG